MGTKEGKPKAKTQTAAAAKRKVSGWRPALEVGVAAIDRQHRTLMRRVDALREGIAADKASGDLSGLLAQLVDCAGAHFAWEEKLMRSAGYPGLSDHRAEHAKLLEQVQLLHQDLAAKGANPREGLSLFVKAWAEHHTATSDRRLAEYLKKLRQGPAKAN